MTASCEFRDDVYGRDRQLLAILKGSELKVADVPVEHHDDMRRREALAIPDGTPLTGGPSGPGGRARIIRAAARAVAATSSRGCFGGGFNHQPAAAPAPKRHAAAPTPETEQRRRSDRPLTVEN